MRNIARRLLIATLLSIAVGGLSLWCLYQASRRAPAFYQQAIAAPVAAQVDEGEQLERAALDLHNQLQHFGRWEACLTQEQVNGWLAIDLPAKFPHALPSGLSEPRIAIEDGMLRIALRYSRGGVDTVLSIAGEAYLTAQPNEIAVRLDQARAGLVPIPLTRFLDEVAERAALANVPMRWTEVGGAPVALIRPPLDTSNSAHRHVVLDRLRLGQGQLVLGGHTEEVPPAGDEAHSATAGHSSDKDTRQR
ncbi:MAG: hypothetical protein JF612_03925 [Planctomycetia bacterium]|jgi:hypothetical protein|nr:hypothetical protein [Planctomycetia bacterium]